MPSQVLAGVGKISLRRPTQAMCQSASRITATETGRTQRPTASGSRSATKSATMAATIRPQATVTRGSLRRPGLRGRDLGLRGHGQAVEADLERVEVGREAVVHVLREVEVLVEDA